MQEKNLLFSFCQGCNKPLATRCPLQYDKIDDYFFDIIFHLTDNQKELDYTAQVLNKYLKKVSERDGGDSSIYESLVNFYRTRDIPKLPGKVEDLTTGTVREVR